MLVWVGLFTSLASAHLLPAQNATINIIDNAAFVVVSVPVSALSGVDDNRDGMLTPAEIQLHSDSITQQFSARFHVSDRGKSGATVLNWIVPPQTDGSDDRSTYVVLMQRVNFASPIQNPEISTDLFGTAPNEASLTITATRDSAAQPAFAANAADKLREVAILEAGANTHQFFRGPWAIFRDFLVIGYQHILGGYDHLLFLLTIIVSAASWRYWFGVVTSFTIAHSMTLALSAFNVLRLPAHIIEPSIAASIVLMALLNLYAINNAKTPSTSTSTSASAGARANAWTGTWTRMSVVFGCGLLHGFGFASAIGAMAVDTQSRIATLAGFNLGIEIGQLLFVLAALLLMAIGKRLVVDKIALDVPRLASITAIILGMVFFAQRLVVN